MRTEEGPPILSEVRCSAGSELLNVGQNTNTGLVVKFCLARSYDFMSFKHDFIFAFNFELHIHSSTPLYSQILPRFARSPLALAIT